MCIARSLQCGFDWTFCHVGKSLKMKFMLDFVLHSIFVVNLRTSPHLLL